MKYNKRYHQRLSIQIAAYGPDDGEEPDGENGVPPNSWFITNKEKIIELSDSEYQLLLL